MRRILLGIALFLAPLTASAQGMPLGQVCRSLIGSQVTQCMAAGNGRFIDGGAGAACARLIGSQVVSCVGVIAGKDYSPDDVQACGGLIGSQVIDCFRASGRPHYVPPPPPPPPPLPPPGPRYERRHSGLSDTDIRAEIAAALEALRANDPIGAERRLRRLLNDLR